MIFGYQINVFVTFCGIFGVFFTVVGPILHERCLENCVRSVFRGGLPERSGEPLHVASLHKNLRVSFLCAWCVVRKRLFKLKVWKSCVHFLHWLRVFTPPPPDVSVAGHEDVPFVSIVLTTSRKII